MVNFFSNRLFFSRQGKPKKECLLALDIGTEFIKAIILKAEGDISEENSEGRNIKEQGVIIGFGRQRQSFGNMLAGAVADIDGVVSTCQKAIDQAVRMSGIRPKKAVIGVAGEFVKGVTTNFAYQRVKPEQEIDLAELQNIIQKIQWNAFNKMRSQLAWETCRSEVEIKPINALITEVRIDGYQVTNPLGFQGKDFFLSIFNVYAPIVHLQALETIASKLDLELLSIVAESYALTRSSSFNPAEGVIFIDIGGGTTDVALVYQGRVEGIKSLSLAGQSFTKRLGQSLGLDFNEAEEIKIKHSHNRLSQPVQRKIRGIFKQDIGIWLNGVELVLEEFNQNESFPSLVLLCGGGSLLPGIKNILRREITQKRWLDKFSFGQPFQVGFIHSKHINNIVDQTEMLKGAQSITPLALASLALEIITDEKKVLPPILRRVVRIMR